MGSTKRAFTLIEILIVVVILAILAAIAIPQFANATEDARPASMSANVRLVRYQIEYHSALGDVELSTGGYPRDVDNTWFPNHVFPKHSFTGRELNIRHRLRPAEEIYPADKTYNAGQSNPSTAWYNRANGAFVVLVPNEGTDAQKLARFNLANGASITALNQVQ